MQMSYSTIDRRRFIVLVSGAGGTLLLSGCAPENTSLSTATKNSVGSNEGVFLGESEPAVIRECLEPLSLAGSGVSLEDHELRVVEGGFMDATVWQGQLVTLRRSPRGATLWLEQNQTRRSVPLLNRFEALSVGSYDGALVLGGYRMVEDGPVPLRAGRPYRELIEAAGSESAVLLAEPFPPVEPESHSHVPLRYRPAVIVSDDLSDWTLVEVTSTRYPGGAAGAIVEREGILAVTGYIDDEVPDSASAVELFDLGDVLRGSSSPQFQSLPSVHGSLWGTVQAVDSELVVVSDLDGTRAMTLIGEQVFSVPRFDDLLGVHLVDESYNVAVRRSSGSQVLMTVRSDGETSIVDVDPELPVLHSVSPYVVVASGCATSGAPK